MNRLHLECSSLTSCPLQPDDFISITLFGIQASFCSVTFLAILATDVYMLYQLFYLYIFWDIFEVCVKIVLYIHRHNIFQLTFTIISRLLRLLEVQETLAL